MEKLSADNFADMVVNFTTALGKAQKIKPPGGGDGIDLDEQEQIIELFRIWFIDCREQEMISEARSNHENDPYGTAGGGGY